MIATYGSLLVILATSLVLGRALLALFGERRPGGLAGPVGFAALVTLTPFLIRLPGRATTTAVLLATTLLLALLYLWRKGLGGEAAGPRASGRTGASPTRNSQHGREYVWTHGRGSFLGGDVPARPRGAIAVVLIVVAACSLPFVLNDRLGILGEGIYTNDHAAQLYWADWLKEGFGPEPSGVRFGYPVGPQSVAAVAAEATGADLVEAFNGLLLAIPALTGLAALGALGALPSRRRVIAASLAAIPYLAVSFYAQSAFKETAMALFVLALAIALGRLADPAERRAAGIVVALLAAASILTYSLPGVAWFALALPLWIALEWLWGRRPVRLDAVRDALGQHRRAAIVAGLAGAALVAVVLGPAIAFVDKIDDVQASAGRLSSPIFPGEAFGVWPEGDFRLVRGEVAGAVPATLLGLAAAGFGALVLLRRRDAGPLAVLVAGAGVYAGARLFAEIHVEAKALAVIAPLIVLTGLAALLAPRGVWERRGAQLGRYAFGAVFALALAGSSFLALRAAPVGFADRGEALERLGERIQGESVVFLGVDRFAAYRLRGTLVRSPGGYVPPGVQARPEKTWQQGLAMDLDTLEPRKLDEFDYAITTDAAYQSAPPPNLDRIAQEGGYVLWERTGSTPRSRVLDEDGDPGAVLDCAGDPQHRELSRREGEALVSAEPVVGRASEWRGPERVGDAAAGQESAFLAPATAEQALDLPAGRWRLSLQYASQVPLTVVAGASSVELPASLEGMYLTAPGGSAFHDAGEVTAQGEAPLEVRVVAAEPGDLQDAFGVERRVWLGKIAALPVEAGDSRETVSMAAACGRYVDRFTLRKRGGGRAGG